MGKKAVGLSANSAAKKCIAGKTICWGLSPSSWASKPFFSSSYRFNPSRIKRAHSQTLFYPPRLSALPRKEQIPAMMSKK
jgi:hypothetical protein